MTGDLRPFVGGADVDARADWERRIYQRLTDTTGADGRTALPAPGGVEVVGSVGHIRLSWDRVPAAAGYLIERTAGHDGEPEILHHGGSDVPAVAACEFADTGVRDGVDYSYRIGAVVGAEYPAWSWSRPVQARTARGEPGPIDVTVDAATVTGRLQRVWQMVGSERLSQLGLAPTGDRHDIAGEFAAALRQAQADLGTRFVRAHAILHDDVGVVDRASDGALRFCFEGVDAIYDQLLEIGIRPVVELSFMPAVLARDPERTVFTYGGIISPPSDWGEWRQLIAALVGHLVDRYGIEEVAQWAFEVWNEPNLVVFWSGTQQEYLRLYDEAAAAIKSVSTRLRVGGPATAAAEWIELLAVHARESGSPLDFVSTHTYGNLPLDVRPALSRAGFDSVPIWWTEWGVGSTHFGSVHDGVLGAPFALSGFAAAQGQIDALAYWVISDHFEELGRPPRLFHNGFGLLTVGNLRKPRYWAVHLAEQLGDHTVASRVDGDGAGVLVQVWATRSDHGTVDVLVWNATVNAGLAGGDPRLDRRVCLKVAGLSAGPWQVRLARVDQHHSNIAAHFPEDVDWPDEPLWTQLRAADRLDEVRLPDVTPTDGSAHFDFEIPMPGIVRIRLQDKEIAR